MVTAGERPAAPPIDPRLRARRVAVRREEGRRRLRVVIGAATLAAVVGATVAVTRSPLLDLDRIEVRGAARTPAGEVARAGGLRTGALLVDLDLEGAARAIERLPWVAAAEVTRRWPGTVEVVVAERTAAAAAAVEGGWALLAADGRVLAHVPHRPAEVAAVGGLAPPGPPGSVVGLAERAPLEVAAALAPVVRARVASVELTTTGEVELVLASPTKARVRLGTTDRLDAKLMAVETVLAKVSAARLVTLDVRAPETPVVTRNP